MDDNRALLRHTLATLAYRGIKAIDGAPAEFASTRACPTCRSAIQILAHIGDLMDWALTLAEGQEAWNSARPQEWAEESARLVAGLQRLDDFLKSDQPLGCSAERLFQGPIADALTHVGQIATLRRLAGAAVRGENYYKAEITAGRVGTDQSTERQEFD
jgi:hypothetical protein